MPLSLTDNHLPPVNPGEYHVACALVVDTSKTMEGDPIDELNQGLVEFGKALALDDLAQGRTDITIISFNSAVNTEMGFRPAAEYEPPILTAGGLTSMNEAINVALDTLNARRTEYHDNGIQFYRPWLFLLTDGAPTDEYLEKDTREKLQQAIRNKKVVYLPMGIGENADIAKLQSYYPDEATSRPVLKASATNFKEAFSWLSDSLSVMAHSDPCTATAIQTPPTPSHIVVGD
jgi:uncharacterized protein YegL